MGRAIVRKPSVFLMDEPLSNLDAKLRVQMRADIAALQDRLAVTTVYVTHDQSEAMTLGHRVAVLNNGLLQQFDAPRVLYERPTNTFVAGFIGSPAMNLITAPLVADDSVALGDSRVALPAAAASHLRDAGGTTVTVGFRPESLELDGEGIPACVEMVEEIGAEAHVYCATELAGETVKLVATVGVRKAPRREEHVALRPLVGEAHWFDPATGTRL